MLNKFNLTSLLVLCYALISQSVWSQTLILKFDNDKSYKYYVSSKQLLPVDNAAYDSLYSLRSVIKIHNKYEGDSNCCIRFFIQDKILLLRYCTIRVMRKDKILWSHGSVDCSSNCEDCNNENSTRYSCPQLSLKVVDFSKDNEWVLLVDYNGTIFTSRCTVVEYNINTGSKKTYRRKVANPSYSPNEGYLLMRNTAKNGRYYIFDRITNKEVKTFNNVKEISWVNEF